MAPLIGGSFVRHIIYLLSLIRGGSNDSAHNGTRASSVAAAVSCSNYSRLHNADEDEDMTIKPDADGEPIAIDPPLFFISPFQLWAGRLVSRVNKADGVLDDRWLPKFPSRGSASLRKIFSTFPKPGYQSGSSSGPWTFVFQFEVGGMAMLGFVLELLSSILSLLAPWILHRLLITPRSVPLAVSLVATTILSTLLGRARDPVCRTHAIWIDGILGSTIFAKAPRLCASARVDHPPAKIINLSSVDVAFLSHYVARLHDIWSAPMQILAIACLAVSIMTWPALAGFVAMAALVYWAAGNEPSAQMVFPSLAYFNLLSQPVFQASLALSRQFSVKPSLSRISNLLYADELEEIKFSPPEESGISVSYGQDKADEESYFLQDKSSPPSCFGLRVGDLGIPSGRLTAVIGPTGSGKTSLLLSILGQLSAVSGHITLHGDVSYAAQEPMILSGTFKDNITLGGRITSGGGRGQSRYRDVLQRTGLDIDLFGCPGGPENAVIGESGSNLSGGQRARVGLARALYSDAKILLLDDPLAAVNARVRNILFDAFRDESRTVVLDYIVVLDKNQVVWSGNREAFMANQSLRSKYLAGAQASDMVPGDKTKVEKSQTHDPASNSNGATSAVHEEAVGLVEDEERAKGALKWKVLAFYTTAAGGTFQALSALTMAALLMGARITGQYWFVWWIGDSAGLAQSTYIGVYLALVVAQSTLIAALGLVLVYGSNRASRAVHDRIVENLLSAPLARFQSQPTGRILNRLGRDIGSVDSNIMNAVDGLVAAGTTLLSSLVLIAATGSFMFATVVPFLVRVQCPYKSRAEPVLKWINLKIPAGQRLGIVGRTGSGRSTLLSALARLVDPQSGSISLSGVEISQIAPRKLRSVVCTLPQEPLIFKGTLRRNLDPHGQHRDSELDYMLEVCQLRDLLQTRFQVSPQNDESVLLDKELSSGGSELSMGQRQLLCAARVLLAKPKVLLVDEAAANIDLASDAILQRALQEMLPESTTMVVIAHRAASLAWMDRIIAMETGQVVEDDSPLNLLQGRSQDGERSYYASMG
ncbi:P-loop containing nucleoside triphosphate hydrolase protein [Rhypophila decipiens]|uniref:P-loop containing nucleoside triphosphate hydrolase protein n=1 Tax=Rhypophila decipiens TaxID=261697 RepID=A0AAN6Y0S5_9PEZI|nr:P-loop containing nucleoside triphosphate hydrolase protein [Rhypophila decipiens]